MNTSPAKHYGGPKIEDNGNNMHEGDHEHSPSMKEVTRSPAAVVKGSLLLWSIYAECGLSGSLYQD